MTDLVRVPVLDHGYVAVVRVWGSEEEIIEAARMSTQRSFEGWGDEEKPGDERLLAFLYRHRHMTPFEMAGLIIEVQAPIFVVREWHRHRTQSYNEMSARYAPLPDVNYVPSIARLMANANGANHQANRVAGAPALTEADAAEFQQELRHSYDVSQVVYEHFLSRGVPKELARAALPVGRYTRMRASANLRNWLAFMTERTSPEAQWEIRQYALEVSRVVERRFPRVFALWAETRK